MKPLFSYAIRCAAALMLLCSLIPAQATDAAPRATAPTQVRDLSYSLPTGNKELFSGNPENFFMYVDRKFEGVESRPWKGGDYGFTRNAFRASDNSIMYSRMHEGIDVMPMHRDERGEPLDLIHPIAPGLVVYVSANPGRSNYGRYIVIGHRVPEGVIFSLYAHLRSINCVAGERVTPKSIIAEMGYSGAGLNRRRAHLHLEVALMANKNYPKYSPKSNVHSFFNGMNLIGFDPKRLLMESRGNKPVSISKYFQGLEPMYRILVPYQKVDMLERHPFLYKGKPNEPTPVSLEFVFTAEGVPLEAHPSSEPCSRPRVLSTKSVCTLQQNVTMNRLKNSSENPALTVNGKRFINNILWHPSKNKP